MCCLAISNIQRIADYDDLEYNQISQQLSQKNDELKQNHEAVLNQIRQSHEQALGGKSIEHNRLVTELKENQEKMLQMKQEETNKAMATIEGLNKDAEHYHPGQTHLYSLPS